MAQQTRNLIRWILIGLYVAGALLLSGFAAARWITAVCLAAATFTLSGIFVYSNRRTQDARRAFVLECTYDILLVAAALLLFGRLTGSGGA